MTPLLVCLIEPSELVLFTDFAFQANNGFEGKSMLSFRVSGTLFEHIYHPEIDGTPWKGLVPNFLKYVPDINAQLKAAGRAEIQVISSNE